MPCFWTDLVNVTKECGDPPTGCTYVEITIGTIYFNETWEAAPEWWGVDQVIFFYDTGEANGDVTFFYDIGTDTYSGDAFPWECGGDYPGTVIHWYPDGVTLHTGCIDLWRLCW